jgi:uncharacterized protein (DUF58 family)
MRPLKPWRPVASVVAVLGIWWLVGHNSGAGWVQMIGDGMAATLAIGLFGPAVVLRRSTITVTAAPEDATAGLPVEISIAASTRVRARPVDPPGPEVFAGAVRGRVTSWGDRLTLVPDHRGIYGAAIVDVATAAPFSLMWWSRRVVMTLPTELLVAPRLGEALPFPPRADDASGDGLPRAPSQVGEPRAVRPYRAGDGRRWVHWPATAHTSHLMVREMEAPTEEPVTVTVVLGEDSEAAERAAERALGTITRILDAGIPVVLATEERGGAVISPIDDRRQAGRRLARAVPPTGAGSGSEMTRS